MNIQRKISVQRNKWKGVIRHLPILVLMPHSSCNCRCIMCDIWKANANKRSLSEADIEALLPDLKKLKVQEILLSGGEALMHPNLWRLCRILKKNNCKITLLSTGLLLEKYAGEILNHIDEIVVSLDGPREIHNQIRNIPMAFEQLAGGVNAVRCRKSNFPFMARCVIQNQNFRHISQTVEAAKEIGLDQISFLTADVSSEAFNRPAPWEKSQYDSIVLSQEEAQEFGAIIKNIIDAHSTDFTSKFIAESPDKMRRFVEYFKACNGDAKFPPVSCNAPWVSAVLEADKSLRPCFFQASYEGDKNKSLLERLNAENAIDFRNQLDVKSNAICRRCVCSLNY